MSGANITSRQQRIAHRRELFRRRRRNSLIGAIIIVFLFIILIGSSLGAAVSKPIFKVAVTLPQSYTVSAVTGGIQWPPNPIESAVGVVGSGVLATNGDATPKPLASVTKLMTAYLILKDFPMSPSGNGFNYTVTQLDQTEWATAVSQGDSESRVMAGEVLSERTLLTYLLVPSADNVADLLARIDAKTVSSFVVKMNAQAKALGMYHTTYLDPSGLNPGDVSTAFDQTILAMQLIQNPIVKQIVDHPSINFPVSGWQQSTNPMLGVDGTYGIKTGYTPQAGGVLVFATPFNYQGLTLTVVGVMIGLAGTYSILRQLAHYGQLLFQSITKGLQKVNLPSQNDIGQIREVGGMNMRFNLKVNGVTAYLESGTQVFYAKRMIGISEANLHKGAVVGTLYVTVGNLNNYSLKIFAD